MRILIIGGSGLLGKKLLKLLSYDHEVGGAYNTRSCENCKHLDITDRTAVEQFIDFYQPDVLIHTAAIANADQCEENKELCWKINVGGTKNLVEICKRYGVKFVYISSDYIFNGNNGQYTEQSKPKPTNFYGITKLEGERIITEELIDYILIRPTILYGYNDESDKETFVSYVRKKVKNGVVEVDNYIKKYPILIDDVAILIKNLLEKGERGVFHICGKDEATRYEWALRIADVFNLDKSKIIPIKKQYSVHRPYNVQLTSSKIGNLRVNVSSLNDGLKKIKMQEGCTFKLFYGGDLNESALGMNVALFRIETGKVLAIESQIKADIVVPIPETGIFYAIGYSEESDIPLRFGIIKEKYSKKTLFEPRYEKRISALEKKLVVIPDMIKNKRIILIDEALLSGSTLKVTIEKLKNEGVREIHVRLGSPQILYKCPAGEHPSSLNLLLPNLLQNISSNYQEIENELCNYFNVDSFRFLTLKALSEDLLKKTALECLYCFNGRIP